MTEPATNPVRGSAARSPVVPPPSPGHLSDSLRRNIDVLARRRASEEAAASWGDRIAGSMTRFTGSMTFVYLHLAAYAAWIVANLGIIPGVKPFDPSFVILASEASVEAIFLSTFVLISQNKMAAAADKRADLDLHISLLTEHELTKIAAVIDAMAAKLGVNPPSPGEMREVEMDVAPEAVLDEIEDREKSATK